MSDRHQEMGIEEARKTLGAIADQAHNEGVITYLTRHGRPIAAVIPVGSSASAIPDSAIDAAMDAAWPGLPEGISLSEARRRTVAALNAAYPHLADLLDAAERRAIEAADALPDALQRLADSAKQASGQSRTLYQQMEAVVQAEVPEPVPGLVQRLVDLVDEQRIRSKQDALQRGDRPTEK